MPTNRTRRTRTSKRNTLPDEIRDFLLTGIAPGPGEPHAWEIFDLAYDTDKELTHLWDDNRDALMKEWLKDHPGRRPFCWWIFDAPQPRQRIAGTGTPAFEVLSYVPAYEYGLPTHFVSEFDEAYYNGRAVDVHGQLIPTEYKPGDFEGKAIDPDDPPVYESEVSYLLRLNMLTKDELKRLSPADYEPEIISPMEDFKND